MPGHGLFDIADQHWSDHASPGAAASRTGQQHRCATAVGRDPKPVNDAHLILPEGWKLDLTAGQSDTKLHGRVTVPSSAQQGNYQIGAKVTDQEVYSSQILSYPHIRPQTRFAMASANIALVDTASLNGLRIGWIDGGVDEAHHWLGCLVPKLSILTTTI